MVGDLFFFFSRTKKTRGTRKNLFSLFLSSVSLSLFLYLPPASRLRLRRVQRGPAHVPPSSGDRFSDRVLELRLVRARVRVQRRRRLARARGAEDEEGRRDAHLELVAEEELGLVGRVAVELGEEHAVARVARRGRVALGELQVRLGERAAGAAPGHGGHQHRRRALARGEEVVELLLGVDRGDEAAAGGVFGVLCGRCLAFEGGGTIGRRRSSGGLGLLPPLAVRRGVEGSAALCGRQADVVEDLEYKKRGWVERVGGGKKKGRSKRERLLKVRSVFFFFVPSSALEKRKEKGIFPSLPFLPRPDPKLTF